METRFRGWIPNVTGRLSFSHFGQCDIYPTESVNRADPNTRYIIVHQYRETWDALLPFRRHLGEWVLGLRGQMHFFCVARTDAMDDDQQAKLVGNVYLLTDKKKWKTEFRTRQGCLFKGLNSYFYTARAEPISTVYDPLLDRFRTELSGACSFQAEFLLRRNGIIELTVRDDFERARNAPTFPTDSIEMQHIRHILSAQMFFFLRDIGHKHQHHSARTDTIVDLYEVSGDDDRTWRVHTLYSIYRRIISYKRQRAIDVQIKSLGLLAYAKAFSEICERDDKITGLPTYLDGPLRESIQASEVSMRYINQQKNEGSATRRTVALWLLGFLISLAALIRASAVDLHAKPFPLLVTLTRAVIEKPFSFGLVVFGVFYFWRALDKGVLRPQASEWMRRVQGIVQALPKQAVAAILFLLGAIFLLVASAILDIYWGEYF